MLKVQMASSDERDRPLVVTDEYLQYLAGELRGEWRDVARCLGISEYTIFNKASDYRQNLKEAIYQTLLSWKQSKGQHATYEVVSEALSKASRRDLSTESNILHKEGDRVRKRPLENQPASEKATDSSGKRPNTENPIIPWSTVGEGSTSAGMKKTKNKIFISFSMTSNERAAIIKDRLEKHIGKGSCWTSATGIRGGDNIGSQIVQAIQDAEIIICLITKDYVNSQECENEVRLFHSLTKNIMPVLLEKVEWPLKKSNGEPSPMQKAFAQRLFVNLHNQTRKEDEFKKMISTISSLLGLQKQAFTGYGKFLFTLESLLSRQNAITLAVALEYTPSMMELIHTSDNPSQVFVQLMNERGYISPTDISQLVETMEAIGLRRIAAEVKEAFELNVQMVHPAPEINEKEIQFVEELKSTYRRLFGKIQPAPFLQDKYSIDKLYVESGIEFLEDRHGQSKGLDTWKKLKDYKTVLTDPHIKSKRRIIDGEPGYGKSTLALQMAYDWCEAVGPMKDYQIVILLQLRQLGNQPSVFSSIKQLLLPKDSQLTEGDIKSILHNSSTLFVLDGYDEYPGRENKDADIARIIRGEMFQEHEVVLTTRTSCLPPNHSEANIKRIRLTGFDDASRETYIRNVVAQRYPDKADRINQLLRVNPVTADLCKIPSLFTMFSFLAQNSEKFWNFKTVTQLLRIMIRCFHDHRKNKADHRNLYSDHSKLDEITYEGLVDKVQQMSWDRTRLRNEIGHGLYDEYVAIGILMEEEFYNVDKLAYCTQTRFVHKLFAEWYAAHYLARVASQSLAEFEQWPDDDLRTWLNPPSQVTKTSQDHQASSSAQKHSLKSLNPHDVEYMYRFACGLNSQAALKIINHLATRTLYDQFTLLCITECSETIEKLEDTVALLASRTLYFRDTDSLLLQASTLELIKFASNKKISIARLEISNCLDVGHHGYLRVKPSNLSLPVINPLRILVISAYGREMTEEETATTLEYSAKCLELTHLLFYDSLLPKSIKITEPASVLRSRHVEVAWLPGSGDFLLNLYSGQWQDDINGSGKLITDEEYQKAVQKISMKEETYFDNYKRLKNDISFMLKKDEYMQLAEFLKISFNQLDSIRSVRLSTRTLLLQLEEKGMIHPSDVSALGRALSALNTNAACYAMVVMYQNNVTEISSYDRFLADLSTHITSTMAKDLCKYLKFPYGLTDIIIASSNPGLSLLLELDKTGFVKSSNVRNLEDPFSQFQLVQAVAKIREYELTIKEEGDIYQQKTSLTMKDQKKMLFMECLKKKMEYWYDAMTPVPWKKSCQWRSTDLYVGSLLIFKDSNSTNRHIVTDKKCKLQYNEIFSHDNLSTEKRIIVEGEPGCGKTMLTAQLGYDWSQGLLEDVDILVLLPLKFVGSKTLLEAINEFYIPSRISLEETDIDEILSSPTERIGVLLDGLEEYFYHESSEVAQVFTENKHPDWKVVLTSRSNCATGLPKTIPRLQIDLFGEEERNNYIEKLYKQDLEKQEEVKTAINNSAFILNLCSVPLLFVLAVHSIETESTVENDHFQRAGTFMQNMISTLTAKRPIQQEISEPSTEHSLRTMLYLGEVAFNGIRTEGQQLYWQRRFLEKNVEYAEEWIDSGVLIVEEYFGTTEKKANRKDELKVKEPDAVPLQDDGAEKKSVQPSNFDRKVEEQEEEKLVVNEEKNYTLTTEPSSENDDKESATAIIPTTKHVPQMVKFLHRIVQEWFAAAYFSTMLKKCTNRDQYDECVSEHLPQISPTDLHYVLRFSCFLHPPFFHTIIKYLLQRFRLKDQSIPSYIMDCICLCFVEHHGSKDSDMEEVVAKVCKEEIVITSRDSRMLQSAKCALLQYASQSMITIDEIVLTDNIIDATKNAMILDYKISFNVLETLRKVQVNRWDQNLSKDHYENILEFLATGSDIKEIICRFPDPPPSPLLQETKTKIMERKISVTWIIGVVVHTYDPTTDSWTLTTTQQMASRDMASNELKRQDKGFLETSARVSNRRCVLTIVGTGVELHLPPNAFHDQETERTVILRIMPYHLLGEHSQRFEDHCTAVVEILPNKEILLSAAKLVLPHCLKLRNPRYCNGQVFESHHTPGQQPDWKNISESASPTVFHKYCEVSLKNFCWVKIKLECGHEVIGKTLIVYATGDKWEEHSYATVNVGFHQDTPGADKIYRDNRGDYDVTQYFMFRKEPQMDLQLTLAKTKPDIWKADSNSAVIPYEDIDLSLPTYRSFVLEEPESESPTPLHFCHFKVSKGTECYRDLLLKFKKTTDNPPLTDHFTSTPRLPSMDEKVTDEMLLELSPKLGNKWKFIGRWLGLENSVLNQISSNNAGDQAEMAYDMLQKWKEKNGRSATCSSLENAFTKVNRVDLVDELKAFQGAN